MVNAEHFYKKKPRCNQFSAKKSLCKKRLKQKYRHPIRRPPMLRQYSVPNENSVNNLSAMMESLQF